MMHKGGEQISSYTMLHKLNSFKLRNRTHWGLQFASGLYADLGWRAAWSHLTPGAGQDLALLGNCCSVETSAQRLQTAEFLRRAAATWQTVYLVPGPRELAGSNEEKQPFYEQLDELRAIAIEVSGEWNNIHIMDKGETVLRDKNIAVLGTTNLTTAGEAWAGSCGGPIWKGDGQQMSKRDIKHWHYECLTWLHEKNTWWEIYDPEVRKVILTYDLWMDAPIGGGSSPILDSLPPRSAYAWLCGIDGANISGMSRQTLLASNGLRFKEDGPMNRFYDPGRCLQIPLPKGGSGEKIPSPPTLGRTLLLA